jgi:hypothetical protein
MRLTSGDMFHVKLTLCKVIPDLIAGKAEVPLLLIPRGLDSHCIVIASLQICAFLIVNLSQF